MSIPHVPESSDRGDDAGIIARYTCGCSVVRDFNGREYQQLSLLCAGGAEHLRRVENPTRENAHLWRPALPFGEDVDE